MDTDVYYHKTVTFSTGKQSLRFRTSQELFSSHDIDTGTRFLLRSIIGAGFKPQRILDLGCGYGPIGLTLKKLYPDSALHMVDRDALALSYSRQNVALNGLDSVEIYGSLSYDDVKQADFDLIVSNIPGKAGEAVITHLLQEAHYYLTPDGLAAVVVVAALETTVMKILENTPDLEIVLRQKRSGHAIFHYKFSGEPVSPKLDQSALERGIYHRKDISMHFENINYDIQTAYGLPEFDSLGYGSQMLVKTLKELPGRNIHRAVNFNPGQGHIAVMLWKLVGPEKIVLIDRDLLALRYSHLNLVRNGCPADKIHLLHQVGLEIPGEEKIDLFTGVLREEEGRDAILLNVNKAGERLSPDGTIIVSAGSTAITRLAADVASEGRLRIKTRGRRRGHSLLVLGVV
jgi:16S rRNA (guanine1207-N2)-methyltransferase